MYLSAPRGLKGPALDERKRMLKGVEAVQPLREYVDGLVKRRNATVPHFDPAGAGVNARVLILLEAPGPMANSENPRPGSGFISIDNLDKTAENSWTLCNEAGLGEDVVIHWNVVPWYLGRAHVKPKAMELREGAAELIEVMRLLERLRVVVACGRLPQRGWDRYVAPIRPDLRKIESWHPSPLALNSPIRWAEARQAFAEAASIVKEHG